MQFPSSLIYVFLVTYYLVHLTHDLAIKETFSCCLAFYFSGILYALRGAVLLLLEYVEIHTLLV